MADRAFTCIVCEDVPNRNARQPVSLPCGHTFCRQCLVRIHNEEGLLRCPTCRRCHNGQRPEELPPNFTLLAMLEVDEQSDRNENHSTTELPSAADSGSTNQPEVNPDSESPGGSNSDNPNGNQSSQILKGVGIAAGAIAGGAAVVAAAPLVLTAVGFTSAGIAAGSWAASLMSYAAIANGGGVVAGGVVATLQSAGAAGVGIATAAGGATAGGGLTYGLSKFFGRSRNGDGDANETVGNNDESRNDGGPSGGDGKKGSSSQSNTSQEGKDDRKKDDGHDKQEEEKDDDSEKDDDEKVDDSEKDDDEKDDDSEKDVNEKEDASDTQESGDGKGSAISLVDESTTEPNDRGVEQSENLLARSDNHQNMRHYSHDEEEEFLNARKFYGDAFQRNLIDFADEE